MIPIDTNSAAALEFIEPKASDRQRCALAVAKMITFVRETPKLISSAQQRKHLRALDDALRRVKAAVDGLPESTAANVFYRGGGPDISRTAFLEVVRQLRENVELYIHSEGPINPKADMRKTIAAFCAEDLLANFGKLRASKYEVGAYYALTAALFEAATGEKIGPIGVKRSCDAALGMIKEMRRTNAEKSGRQRS